MTIRRPVAATFVAAWMLCGFAGNLLANAYLLLGVPFVVVFQRYISRKPLRSMWVHAAPPFKLGRHG